jgi:hypothetical protein
MVEMAESLGGPEKRQTGEDVNNAEITGYIKIEYTGRARNLELSKFWRLKHQKNHEEKS